MEKNMGKLSDAAPYLAVAALAATGVGLAGAGAAGASIAPAAAGAAGAVGTQSGLALGSTLGAGALGTGAAVAPEAAFLASMGASSPAVAPLATEAAASALAPQLTQAQQHTGHFMGESFGAPYKGVSFLGDAPVEAVGGWEQPFLGQSEFAPVTEKAAGDYAFMGGHESLPQWKQLTGMGDVTSYAVEEGTKTLMDQLGIDKSTAAQLAAQFYAGSMQTPPNFQGQPPPTSTGRQRTYSPSTMAQIMDRTRGNYGRKTRTSRI